MTESEIEVYVTNKLELIRKISLWETSEESLIDFLIGKPPFVVKCFSGNFEELLGQTISFDLPPRFTKDSTNSDDNKN